MFFERIKLRGIVNKFLVNRKEINIVSSLRNVYIFRNIFKVV